MRRIIVVLPANYAESLGMSAGHDKAFSKKLKELEAENRRLKQMYANLSLENEALKDIVEKKLSQ